MLDVGTGSGAVALALKHERSDLRVAGSDVSEPALALARANAQRLGLDVEWLLADLLDGVDDRFDAIVANPPYVAESERARLAPEILRHEPPRALFAGPDGLSVIAALVEQAADSLGAAGCRRGRRRAGRARAGALAGGAAFPRCAPSATWPESSACWWRSAEHVPAPERRPMVTAAGAEQFERCLAGGGVALFPADTVYGLACDPERADAVDRLYALKGRPSERPAAVMFFSVGRALLALPELEEREVAALRALLPGPVTLLVPNRGKRFPLACGPDIATLGLRVPFLDGALSALGGVTRAALQSSANASGDREARRLRDVPARLREGADLVLDGGELPGVASTVVDLRRWATSGQWSIVRHGALDPDALASALDAAA